MNPSLTALMTKLTWQLNELNLHLQNAESQSLAVMHQINELEEKINKSCYSPIIINPEFEINRLNFITQEQEKKNQMDMILKNHQAVELKLKDKLQRVKTELKMLEKYTQREEQCHKEQQKKIQEHAMDEWVIQKRETV